jgi:hypothetical protein
MIMTLVLNQEINVKSVQDAMEKAGYFFYRIEKLANSTIMLNECRDGDFQNPAYKQDCLYYQLEAIQDLAKQCEHLFDELSTSFGKPIDVQLKGLAELLPENSGVGVFSSTHPIP